jgi:hypothetical protein
MLQLLVATRVSTDWIAGACIMEQRIGGGAWLFAEMKNQAAMGMLENHRLGKLIGCSPTPQAAASSAARCSAWQTS